MRVRKPHGKQDITYWAPLGENDEGGTAYSTPVTFQGRWEDRAQEFNTNTGETQVSNAVVFVPQEVMIDGYLYRGVSVDASPHNVLGAFPIRNIRRTPDLRSLEENVVAVL